MKELEKKPVEKSVENSVEHDHEPECVALHGHFFEVTDNRSKKKVIVNCAHVVSIMPTKDKATTTLVLASVAFPHLFVTESYEDVVALVQCCAHVHELLPS